MNNPEANLLSPPSRPPPNKKVRGGATPRLAPGGRPIGAPSAAGFPPTSTNVAAAAAGGPPPTFPTAAPSSMIPAATSSSSSSNFSSGSARRQAELRRLRDLRMKTGSSSIPTATATATSSGYFASNQHPSQSSTVAGTASTDGVAPPPPMRPAGQERHHSDLFPSVPKQPSPAVHPKPLIDSLAEDVVGHVGIPTISLAPAPAAVAVAATPPVQRKLEYSNDSASGGIPPSSSLSSSSPPSAVASIAREKAANAAQAKREIRPPAKRSKSAPPRRPPGPPPPASAAPPQTSTTLENVSIPFSRTAERRRLSIERKGPPGSPGRAAAESKQKSPHLVQSSRTTSGPPVSGPPQESFSSPPPTLASGEAGAGGGLKKVYPKTPIPPKQQLEGGVVAGDKTPPSTGNSSRREKIKLMREGAAAAAKVSPSGHTERTSKEDVPPEFKDYATAGAKGSEPAAAPAEVAQVPSKSSNTFELAVAKQRLEQAYEDVTAEKDSYLKQVKELEEKLRQKDEEITTMKIQSLKRLDEDIPPTPSRGFLKGIASSLGTPMRRTKASERVLTPKLPFDENPVQLERNLISHFREAVTCVPFEYESDIARYTIRRPYGSDDLLDLFDAVSMVPPEVYNRRAHVSESEAIEVAATIFGDSSLFLLFGKSGVRYKTNPEATEWMTVENVDDDENTAGPLPIVTYVDDDARDQQYSLEAVLDEALKCREQYCKTVTATAIGFMNRPPVPADPRQDALHLDKTPSRDVATETEEQGPVSTVQVESNTDGGGKQDSAPAEPSKVSGTDVDTTSSDVLMVFIGMIFSSVFGLIYFMLIGLPLQIIRTTIILAAAFAILSTIYLYTAQDMYGTRDMLFLSNTYPGIM